MKAEDTDKTRMGLWPRFRQVILSFERAPEGFMYLRKAEWEKVLVKAGRKGNVVS